MSIPTALGPSIDVDALPPLRRPLVAVLPFTPVNGDAALRLLGSELADMLRERLARVPALGAILISSDYLAGAPEHALELICRQLRVGHLVSGRCHRGPGSPSLYLEVTDTREWQLRWAGFYRGRALDLLAPECPLWDSLQVQLKTALRRPPPIR